jgi:hypothetical protein
VPEENKEELGVYKSSLGSFSCLAAESFQKSLIFAQPLKKSVAFMEI